MGASHRRGGHTEDGGAGGGVQLRERCCPRPRTAVAAVAAAVGRVWVRPTPPSWERWRARQCCHTLQRWRCRRHAGETGHPHGGEGRADAPAAPPPWAGRRYPAGSGCREGPPRQPRRWGARVCIQSPRRPPQTDHSVLLPVYTSPTPLTLAHASHPPTRPAPQEPPPVTVAGQARTNLPRLDVPTASAIGLSPYSSCRHLARRASSWWGSARPASVVLSSPVSDALRGAPRGRVWWPSAPTGGEPPPSDVGPDPQAEPPPPPGGYARLVAPIVAAVGRVGQERPR